MFEDWCDIEELGQEDKKFLFTLMEKRGGRAVVMAVLIDRVRSHYDDLEHIADDVKELGFPDAAAILRERLPQTPGARSGEIGEILATEFIEFTTDFRVPVRRLRYKDGRNMALRGDDFLGVQEIDDDRFLLLKGEAKSRRQLSSTVVAKAREALSNYDGRPTPISLLFITDRLLEAGGADEALGRKLRHEVAKRTVQSDRITHALFVLSARAPEGTLKNDLEAADEEHQHFSACMLIADHDVFIKEVYEKASDLGDN